MFFLFCRNWYIEEFAEFDITRFSDIYVCKAYLSLYIYTIPLLIVLALSVGRAYVVTSLMDPESKYEPESIKNIYYIDIDEIP